MSKYDELDAVLAGTKPFATVERRKNPVLFHKVLSLGKTLDVRATANAELAYCLPKNSALHDRFKFLMSSTAAQVIRNKADHQRALGKLYGYTDEAIEAFILTNDCNCDKCRGNF